MKVSIGLALRRLVRYVPSVSAAVQLAVMSKARWLISPDIRHTDAQPIDRRFSGWREMPDHLGGLVQEEITGRRIEVSDRTVVHRLAQMLRQRGTVECKALGPDDRLLQIQVTGVFLHHLYRAQRVLGVPSDIEEEEIAV